MTAERCPCCKQMLNREQAKPTRICYDCGRPLTRGHRWTFQPREGISVPVVVHRVCANPEGYYRAAECKRIGVVGYNDKSWEEIDAMTQRENEIDAEIAEWQANGRKPR